MRSIIGCSVFVFKKNNNLTHKIKIQQKTKCGYKKKLLTLKQKKN